MSSIQTLAPWTTSAWPTKTVLSSVNPTHSAGLASTYASALSVAQTATDSVSLLQLSEVIRGAQASLSIIDAQDVLATATASDVQASATQAIFQQTVNLISLEFEENLYNTYLKMAPNAIYLAVYSIIIAYNIGMLWKSRYIWYNVTFICGYGLEFAGFIGRVIAVNDLTNNNYFLLQYIALTIAPAFIMAGVYFLFAQLVVIHGRQYSVLKPMWYSYFFIATDVLSLMIQAGGGGAASAASTNHTNPKPGTNTMIAGISLQVVAMTVFLIFWFEFLNRVFFFHGKEIAETNDSPLTRRTVANYFRFLFNVKSVREYHRNTLDPFYNPQFKEIRTRKLFAWFPLAVTCAVVAVYIRCVYRVVELAQGFVGYLVTHEVYLMVLDAFMITIAGLIFVPFHPVHVFGSENLVKVATIKQNMDEDHLREKDDEQLVGSEQISVDGANSTASGSIPIKDNEVDQFHSNAFGFGEKSNEQNIQHNAQ